MESAGDSWVSGRERCAIEFRSRESGLRELAEVPAVTGEPTLREWRRGVIADPEREFHTLDRVVKAAVGSLSRGYGVPRDEEFDVAQTVILRLLASGKPDPDPSPPLVAWVYGVARNVLRETARRERRRTEVIDTVRRVATTDTRDDACTPARGSSDAAVAPTEIDWRALTDKQREALTMSLRGVSQREAASSLGIGRGAYRDRVRRASSRLRSAATGSQPGRRVVDQRLMNDAARALNSGRSTDARALELRAVGLTYREIGQQLGLTYDAARKRVVRARARARQSQPVGLSVPPPPARHVGVGGRATAARQATGLNVNAAAQLALSADVVPRGEESR